MAQCMCRMVLDVAERDMVQTIVARQGDSATRWLRLRLTAYGEPLRVEENAVAVLNAKNAAGEVRAFAGEIHADGSMTLPLNAWMLRTAGVVECDVSIFDEGGGKLTTPPFEIDVVSSVAPDDTLPGDDDGGESVTAKIIAEEKVYDLTPFEDNGAYGLLPQCRRKYALNLAADTFADDSGWKEINLYLPVPASVEDDNWILIYCHAPLRESVPVSVNWGGGADIMFVDGVVPELVKGDFEIICSYSKCAGRWQVGVVQYGSVGESA